MNGAADSDETQREEALDEIRQAYHRYATTGNRRRWITPSRGEQLIGAERERWLVDALAPYVGGTVLDLGCGDGGLAVALDRTGNRPARYVGVDLLADRLDYARGAAPWAEFLVASADRVPLERHSVQAVALVTLLSSVTTSALRRAIAEEVHRVLAPGGRLVIYDLRYPSPGNRHIRRIGRRELAALFPGWAMSLRTMTVLPPLVRTRLGAGRRRYELWSRLPILRSHLAATLDRP